MTSSHVTQDNLFKDPPPLPTKNDIIYEQIFEQPHDPIWPPYNPSK